LLLAEPETSSQRPVASEFRVDATDTRCYRKRLPDSGVKKKITSIYASKKGF
jgi:hypothetical protein